MQAPAGTDCQRCSSNFETKQLSHITLVLEMGDDMAFEQVRVSK